MWVTAGVAKFSVNAMVSNTIARKGLRVRVPPPALSRAKTGNAHNLSIP